ncbi:MAG TPA: hypothetical protein VGD89_14480 [Flavipsychrobacter sp.]
MGLKFLKKITNGLKRKEGGTKFGNILRKVASTASGGALGNGALMLRPGVSKEETDNNFAQSLGAAIGTFNSESNRLNTPVETEPKGFTDYLQMGYIKEKIRRFIPAILGIVGLIILIPIIKRVAFSKSK